MVGPELGLKRTAIIVGIHNACRNLALPSGIPGTCEILPLPRRPQPRCNANIAGQCTVIAKPRQVATFANQTGSSLRYDAGNRGEQFAYLVRFKLSSDLTIDLIHSATQQLNILASIPCLESVGLRVVMRHRGDYKGWRQHPCKNIR